MTQEEKAKAYDEALKKIQPLYEQAKKDDNPIWSTYEHLFPQLRESEDERIRRHIAKFIDEQYPTHGSLKEEKDKMLAYLEKQEEESHDGKKWIYEGDYHKDMERCFNDGKDEVLENPGKYGLQKEQKSAECIEFDNEFKNQVSHLIASVLNKEWEYDKGFVEYAAQQLLGYAKHEIKPAEWSEEDERNAGYLENLCDKEISRGSSTRSEYEVKCDAKEWLASLREKFNFQEKMGWSEEDEMKLGAIITDIETRSDLTESVKIKYVSFLKSLRPQPKQGMILTEEQEEKFGHLFSRSSWKPSEEEKINTEGDFGRGYDCGYQAGYAVAMNEMKPKVATATLDSEKRKEQKQPDLPAGFYVTMPDGKKYYTKEMRCNGMNVKVVEPKPAEWSEEDERIINALTLELKTNPSVATTNGYKRDDYIDWLESIRPRLHCKPSDE